MHCFIHQDRNAVGCCKACGKGLCPDCAVDLGHGLSCKGPHEEVVQSHNAIINFNARTVSAAPKNIYLSPIFTAVLGSIFMWYGFDKYHGIQNFLFILGAVFFVYSCILFFRIRAIYSDTNA